MTDFVVESHGGFPLLISYVFITLSPPLNQLWVLLLDLFALVQMALTVFFGIFTDFIIENSLLWI